jgi:hypothetical protein
VDGGAQWAQFTANLPNVAVRDAVIHPREHDLILATHGRGIYIVDDITPLRKLTPETLGSDVAFLETRPWEMPLFALDFGSIFNGDADFVGTVPEEAAYITYYLKKRHLIGDLKLEVYDSQGRLLTTLPGGKRRGINRVPWPMRLPPAPMPPAAQSALWALWGPRVPAGTYTVKMIKGKETYSSTVTLVPDARLPYSAEERKSQYEATMKLYDMMGRMTHVVEAITDARDQVRAQAEKLPAGDRLRRQLETLAAALEEQRVALVSSRRTEGISGEEKLREELANLFGAVNLHEGRPTESQMNRMAVLGKQLEAAQARFQSTVTGDVAKANAQLEKRKLEAIKPLTEEEWKKRRSS